MPLLIPRGVLGRHEDRGGWGQAQDAARIFAEAQQQTHPACLEQQVAVTLLGSEVTLVQIMATVQQLRVVQEQHSKQLEQQSREIGELRKGLVEHTLHDIRRTASLVMAHARRSAGIAKTHEELHNSISASLSKALQLQAFVNKHCPELTCSNFEEHFDRL